MNIIKLFTILTFAVITSPLHAMLKRNDAPILQKRLGADVEKVKQAEDPDQTAKAIIDEADRWKYHTSHYVCEAAKQKSPKAFTAFLNAGASTKCEKETAMDASLRADFIHGIDTLFNKDKPYDCAPESLAACSEETLLHFVRKVHVFRKDNNQELRALSHAVIAHCNSTVARRFLTEGDDYGYFYTYELNASDDIDKSVIAVSYGYLRTYYAQNAQNLSPRPYEASKRLVLRDAINALNKAYDKIKERNLYRFSDEFILKNNTQAIRELLRDHPITFSPQDKLDLELAHNTYAAAIKYDDAELLSKLEELGAPMPDDKDLSHHMIYRLSSDVLRHIPLSESCLKMVEWCLAHKVNPNFNARNGKSRIDHPLKSILASLDDSTLEVSKKLYALMKNHGAQLSDDEWLESDLSIKPATRKAKIAFLAAHDEQVLRDPKIALLICKWAKRAKDEAVVNRFYPYTPDGHYTARKNLAALKSMFSSQPSRNYLALPTSEVVSDNNNESKKDK